MSTSAFCRIITFKCVVTMKCNTSLMSIQVEKYAFQLTLLEDQSSETSNTNDTPTDAPHHEAQCCNAEQPVLPAKRYRLSFEYVPLKACPHYDNSEEKLVRICHTVSVVC